MARRTKIHVGLEIGTSKTCVVVGEIKQDTSIRVLGIGITKTVGVRKGEISDFGQASTCLKDALAKAEDASDVEIGSVFVSVTGAHFRGVNNKGTFRLPQNQENVLPEHLEEACDIARDVQYPQDHTTLHTIVRKYLVDGLEQTASPIGLFAKNVEADFHIVHGISNRIQNSIRLIRECPLELDDIVFAPIATAQMALDREQRLGGALLIDIGGGTTDYALYLDGVIAASGCIPVGGDHITNDIHLVTGLPFSKAEKMKILEGNTSADPALSVGKAKLTDENGFSDVEIERSVLNEIIRQRLQDTLKIVLKKLPQGSMEGVSAGVFLTGGTSLMKGLPELAHNIFGKDILQAEAPIEQDASLQSFKDPQFATAIGLIRYAQILEAENYKPPGFFGKIFRLFWPFG